MVSEGPAASADVLGASLAVVSDVAEVVADPSVLVSDPHPDRPIPSATAVIAMTPARMGIVMSSPVSSARCVEAVCARRKPDRSAV